MVKQRRGCYYLYSGCNTDESDCTNGSNNADEPDRTNDANDTNGPDRANNAGESDCTSKADNAGNTNRATSSLIQQPQQVQQRS